MTQIFLKSTICRLRKFLPATFAHDFVAGRHSFFNASAGFVLAARRVCHRTDARERVTDAMHASRIGHNMFTSGRSWSMNPDTMLPRGSPTMFATSIIFM